MPELAEIWQLHVTSKGAARDRFPTRTGPSQPPHTPSPEKGCTNVIPDNYPGVIYYLSLHYKKKIEKKKKLLWEQTDARRLKQESLITCLHAYNKNWSRMIHQWKRFGKQIQKKGNRSGNISTPSWSICWTRRAGIVSRPPREPDVPPCKTVCGWENADPKGGCYLWAARSPKQRPGGPRGWRDVFNTASGMNVNSCKHKIKNTFFLLSPQQTAQSGKTDLKAHWNQWESFYWLWIRHTKWQCLPWSPEHALSHCCSVLSSPQAQLLRNLEVQPSPKPCQCWRGFKNRTSQTLAVKKANIKATWGLN